MPLFKRSGAREIISSQSRYFGKDKRVQSDCLVRSASIFFIISLSAIFLYKPVLRWYQGWLMPSSLDPTADMAVILDYSLPRVEGGVELLKEGKVKSIYIDTPYQSNVKKISEEYDIPVSLIHWSGCGASTTYEQAVFFAKAAGAESFPDFKSIVIVTSPYHLRRALWSFTYVLEPKKSGINIKSHGSGDEGMRKKLDWWQYEYARKWVSFETQKNIFYRFRYGLWDKPNIDIPYSSFFDQDGTGGSVMNTEIECKKNLQSSHGVGGLD